MNNPPNSERTGHRRPLRYALVGSGMMGQEHLRNLKLLRDLEGWPVEVTQLIDPDAQMLAASLSLARELGNTSVTAHATIDALDASRVDAVVIASPNFTHFEVLQTLLPLNLAVLVEKPLCTTLADCEAIVAATDDYPQPFWVAMEYRYMPPTARFIERIREGAIGTLQMLTVREHRFPFLEKVGDWNRFNRNSGGTLVEKCCHHFDLMQLIIGAVPVRVFASGAMDVNHRDERYDGEQPDIIDNALVIVDYANGVRASLELCMFADGAESQEQWTALGDMAKLDARIPGPDRFWPEAGERHADVTLQHRSKAPPEREIIKVDAALMAAGDHHGSTFYQHLGFARAIVGEGEVAVTARHGMEAVRIGAAAQESIALGQAVSLV